MIDPNDAERPADNAPPNEESSLPSESLGFPIPGNHVGAFVAEVFEDPERSTSWATAVDATIPDDARNEWERLTPGEQAGEMLRMAINYDEQAIEDLAAIPVESAAGPDDVREQFDEATRCRRNADMLRNAIADAYADELLDADALVTAVEAKDFDTTRVARREQLVESVAEAHEFDFRPYGGTLIHKDDEGEENADHKGDAGLPETW